MLVHRIAGGLHHENIHAAHIFEQLEVNLAIGKALNLRLTDRYSDVNADFFSQRLVGGAAESLPVGSMG